MEVVELHEKLGRQCEFKRLYNKWADLFWLHQAIHKNSTLQVFSGAHTHSMQVELGHTIKHML